MDIVVVRFWQYQRFRVPELFESSQCDSRQTMDRSRSGSRRGVTPPSRGSTASSPSTPDTGVPFVPHLTEKYDPDHPDADWGGIVQRSYKKRLFNDPAATRNNLVYDEHGGLVPEQPQPTESSFSGKKIFDSNQIPGGAENVSGIPFQSAVYQIGPGSDGGTRDWKSMNASQMSMEPTPSEMYALGTRQNSQHRRHVTPAYEQQQQVGSSRGLPPWDSNQPSPTMSVGSSGAGMTGRRVDSRRSLLAGIGKLVASEDLGENLVRPDLHLSEGFANPSAKVLLAENHHRVTLGYTGRRNI